MLLESQGDFQFQQRVINPKLRKNDTKEIKHEKINFYKRIGWWAEINMEIFFVKKKFYYRIRKVTGFGNDPSVGRASHTSSMQNSRRSIL